MASGTGVPPLILTATASTNGAQTRNVVVPSLCGDAPSGSAALAQGIKTSKTEAISHKDSVDRGPASSFPERNRANHIDTSPSAGCVVSAFAPVIVQAPLIRLLNNVKA